MRTADRTVGDWGTISSLAVAVLTVGIAYGAQGLLAGLPGWLVLVLAVGVLGASSELLFVGMLAAGGAPLLAAVAALLVNLRNTVYGLAAGRFLRRGPSRWLAAHFVNDETVAFAAARPSAGDQRRVFWRLGTLILVAWPLGTIIGLLLGAAVDPAVLGLDAVFPVVIFAMLLPALRDSGTRLAAGTGAVVATATVALTPVGIPPLLALTGVLAPVLRRVLGR